MGAVSSWPPSATSPSRTLQQQDAFEFARRSVFAGWSVGAAWAMALWLVSYAVERRQRRHHAALIDETPVVEG